MVPVRTQKWPLILGELTARPLCVCLPSGQRAAPKGARPGALSALSLPAFPSDVRGPLQGEQRPGLSRGWSCRNPLGQRPLKQMPPCSIRNLNPGRDVGPRSGLLKRAGETGCDPSIATTSPRAKPLVLVSMPHTPGTHLSSSSQCIEGAKEQTGGLCRAPRA